MDALWLALAFLLGLFSRYLGLPALVGYLVAGFALNALGQHSSALLDQVTHAAVFLLRSRLKGINWTKIRVIAVFISLPLWGYESFALIDLSFEQQQRMMEMQIRAQKTGNPAQAQEAMEMKST